MRRTHAGDATDVLTRPERVAGLRGTHADDTGDANPCVPRRTRRGMTMGDSATIGAFA